MKKILFCIIFITLFNSICFSAAAINVVLNYDLVTQKLKVQADHQTDKPDKNFIRRVVVFVNSQNPIDFTYTRQLNPVKFSDDLPVAANEGDLLEVEIYSSEGGLAKASLEIPIPPKEDKKAEGESHEQKIVQNGN